MSWLEICFISKYNGDLLSFCLQNYLFYSEYIIQVHELKPQRYVMFYSEKYISLLPLSNSYTIPMKNLFILITTYPL